MGVLKDRATVSSDIVTKTTVMNQNYSLWAITFVVNFCLLYSCFNEVSSSKTRCMISIAETAPFIIGENDQLPLRLVQYNAKLNAMVGYNPARHSIDIWDLNKRIFLKGIYLESEGPNAINDLKSLHFINNDSLIILTNYAFYIINSINVIIAKIPINKTGSELVGINFDSLNIFNDANNRNRIYYNDHCIFFSLKEYNNDFYGYNHAIIGKLNLNTKMVTLLHIKHDSRYRNSSYGLFDKPNITYTKSIIVVNFPIANDIYLYDYNGNLIKHVYPKGQYSYLECKPYIGAKVIDDLNIENHLNSNPTYYPVIYLEKSRKYLRIHRPPVQEDKEKYYLTLYDEQLNLEDERVLSRAGMTLASMFNDQKAIYIYKWGNSEDTVIFKMLTAECVDMPKR